MPKAASKKRKNSAGQKNQHGPYSQPHLPKMGTNIFKMNTDLGQHVLKNPGVADAIIAKAGLKESDIVLEIGPGTGNLTVKALDKVKKVIAVELDPRMASELVKRVQGNPEQKKLDILIGDVIKTDLPYFDVVLSNTPYQISSPLTFKLLALSPSPRTCILMFQREFAQRLTARPGDKLYSRLSVNAQTWAKIDHVMKVSRQNFRPPPAVESSVVRLVPKVPRPAISYEEWDGLLRICFLRKNKILRANFLGTSSVIDLLEANYRTFSAQNGVELDDRPLAEGEVVAVDSMDVDGDEDDEMEWDGFADEDDVPAFFQEEAQSKSQVNTKKNSQRRKRGRVAELVREKVRCVLENKTGLAGKRARMCDEGDFLKLLWAFNQEGIHFS